MRETHEAAVATSPVQNGGHSPESSIGSYGLAGIRPAGDRSMSHVQRVGAIDGRVGLCAGAEEHPARTEGGHDHDLPIWQGCTSEPRV